MSLLDVSKCFDSLYTHSITWALKDKAIAKKNASSKSFGNDFDNLMQHMNFNETNGICIGPEVSRIFSELILSRVDLNIEAYLMKHGLKNRVQYEYRRYVDDYLVFANDEKTLDKITKAISLELQEYKLFLNEQKIENYTRPFHTKKSVIIEKINKQIKELLEKIFEYKEINDTRVTTPKNIRRVDALVRWFIKETKTSCLDSDVGYDMISNYIISTITKKIEFIIEEYNLVKLQSEIHVNEKQYVKLICTLLELTFFFYTVQQTVSSSFNVAKSVIISSNFIKENFTSYHNFLIEKISNWTSQIVKNSENHRDFDKIKCCTS